MNSYNSDNTPIGHVAVMIEKIGCDFLGYKHLLSYKQADTC